MKVFLGGTCNESTWRDELIKHLKIDYFNPVVDDWTPECQEEEIRQREACDICLYVITPRMTGVYAIAEVVDDSNKRPRQTVFCFAKHDIIEENRVSFTDGQMRSLASVGALVERNLGTWVRNPQDLPDVLNAWWRKRGE